MTEVAQEHVEAVLGVGEATLDHCEVVAGIEGHTGSDLRSDRVVICTGVL